VKNIGASFSLLAQDAAPYFVGRTYRLDILDKGAFLEVCIDGALVYSVSESDLAAASNAVCSYGNDATAAPIIWL
jgi:hypothetical protein